MWFKIDTQSSIIVNGKEYASEDELPPEIRQLYEQALESPETQRFHESKIIVNGNELRSPDTMPPDVRRKYEQMMESVQKPPDGSHDSTTDTGRRITLGVSDSSIRPQLPLTVLKSAFSQFVGRTLSYLLFSAILLAVISVVTFILSHSSH